MFDDKRTGQTIFLRKIALSTTTTEKIGKEYVWMEGGCLMEKEDNDNNNDENKKKLVAQNVHNLPLWSL